MAAGQCCQPSDQIIVTSVACGIQTACIRQHKRQRRTGEDRVEHSSEPSIQSDLSDEADPGSKQRNLNLEDELMETFLSMNRTTVGVVSSRAFEGTENRIAFNKSVETNIVANSVILGNHRNQPFATRSYQQLSHLTLAASSSGLCKYSSNEKMIVLSHQTCCMPRNRSGKMLILMSHSFPVAFTSKR